MRIAERRSTRLGRAFFSLDFSVVALTAADAGLSLFQRSTARHAVVIRGFRLDAVVDPAAEMERGPIDGRRAGDASDEIQKPRLEIGLCAAIDAVVADRCRRRIGGGPLQGDFHVGERFRGKSAGDGSVAAGESRRIVFTPNGSIANVTLPSGADRQRRAVFFQQVRFDRLLPACRRTSPGTRPLSACPASRRTAARSPGRSLRRA